MIPKPLPNTEAFVWVQAVRVLLAGSTLTMAGSFALPHILPSASKAMVSRLRDRFHLSTLMVWASAGTPRATAAPTATPTAAAQTNQRGAGRNPRRPHFVLIVSLLGKSLAR